MAKKRCKGWTRTGGAFSLGSPKWEQCEEKAIVNITIKRPKEKQETLPACAGCWEKMTAGEDIDEAKIIKVVPFKVA